MDMRGFLGDTTVRLIGYEMPAEAQKRSPGKHPQDALKYVFNLKVCMVDPHNAEDMQLSRYPLPAIEK
jgi:hypothetical protein